MKADNGNHSDKDVDQYLIELREVTKIYGEGQGAMQALGGVDLRKVLEDSIESYKDEFVGKDVRISMDIQQKPDMAVFADKEQMHQLFSNILDNSLKYTDRNGELIVGMAYRDGQVVIDFRDSLPGVHVEELQRLFDKLYRAEGSRNRASGGAGLGLAICKNIAEAHGGTIAAYPSPLGGVMIKVSIPVAGRQS